jgi:dUTPase
MVVQSMYYYHHSHNTMAEIIVIDVLRDNHCPPNALLKPGDTTDAGYDIALADDAIIPPLSQVPGDLVRTHDLSAFSDSTLESIGYKDGVLPKGSPYTIKDGGIWQVRRRPPLFRTGIHTLPREPQGVWFMVAMRSSTATGWGLRLHNAFGVIDPKYQDEILLGLYSAYDMPVLLPKGERVAQLITVGQPPTSLQMTTDKGILQDRANRGGGWGSTNQPFGNHLIAEFGG